MQVEICTDEETEKRVGWRIGEKTGSSPLPFHLGAPLRPTFSTSLLWQTLSPPHTNRHTKLKAWHFTLGRLWHFTLQKGSHWTAPCQSVWEQRGKNTQMKCREKMCKTSHGRKKKDERRKVYPKLNGEEFHLLRTAHLTSLFQHCQIINVTSLRERLWTKY